MTIDPAIREQGYIYFLSEAPDLLHTIEEELFNLAEERSTAIVHNLMRATHTMKGGAANVGLDVIQQISHALEDVFKALYNPDIVVDAELQTLLFNSYECLNLAVTAEVNSSSYNSENLLNKFDNIFEQIKAKLGDKFGQETYIPTSEELGFDIVLSIFETGVTQNIEDISNILSNSPEIEELVNFLSSQAEIFMGLGESLNLPGFGDIGKTTIAALEINPSQALNIAELVLADLRQAKAAVLAGDRSQGGEVSLALKQLANQTQEVEVAEQEVKKEVTDQSSDRDDLFNEEIKSFYAFLQNDYKLREKPLKLKIAKFYIKIIFYILGWFNHIRLIPKEQLSLQVIVPDANGEKSLHYIDSWLNDFFLFIQELEDSQSLCVCRQGVILTIIIAVIQFLYTENGDIYLITYLEKRISELASEYRQLPPITQEEQDWFKRKQLKQLLIFKDIPNTTNHPSQEALVESVWGSVETGIDNIQANTTPIAITNDSQELSVTSAFEDTFWGTEIHTPEIISEEPEETSRSIEIPSINNEESVEDSPATEIISRDSIDENQEISTVEKQEEEKQEPVLPTTKHRQPAFVRVNIEGLQNLNYLAGELLIYHKRRDLEEEQLQVIIERLNQQLIRHQNTLSQLRDLPIQLQNFASPKIRQESSVTFDSLEMDEYTAFSLGLHEANEETLQLQETVESLDLLFRQSHQLQEKNQRLVLGILETVDHARMSPLGNVLNRFPQMLEKLGNVYGKRVELKLIGTDVLIDKAIAEKLYDPLLHLIRNSFDHGLETPSIRRQNGKPEQGTITIRAYHQGSQTIIEIQDDGQGLNFEKIRTKAIDLNLISATDNPTPEELSSLLFSPGFSTAGKVSEISGRGIGLDIVRSHVEGLDGSISVNSQPNQGTTFMLKIPFSMTTDKLMIVQGGGAFYALLLDSIEKIVLPFAEQIKYVDGKKVLYWNTETDERMLSIRPLSELMFYSSSFVSGTNVNSLIQNTEDMKNPVLVLRKEQEILALEVDQIIGEQELVIRPLGSAIAPPKYVYGCTSLANGTLILVIDGTLLVESKQLPSKSTDLKGRTAVIASGQRTDTSTEKPKSANIYNQNPEIILVVDDAISLRQTLSLTLQKYGYQVIQAENGRDAIDKLKIHPEIQAIISDLEMPTMNGFQLLSTLRQDNTSTKLPVVILTSRSAEKHRKLADALGATAYFTKPYLEEELISTIKGLVNSHNFLSGTSKENVSLVGI